MYFNVSFLYLYLFKVTKVVINQFFCYKVSYFYLFSKYFYYGKY
ncbi:MAG: hypothetical protein BWZ11_00375 [Bacteroidetes bacterium ADurb.BinA395]|nr:MAG: hypothetical protein BWZ11_00375 [Bacteroidetes bacterium ADurb.BinA395]